MISTSIDDHFSDAVRRFERYIGPVAQICDALRTHALGADRDAEIPDSFWNALPIRALNKMFIPEALGGAPLFDTATSRAAFFELFGYADPALAISLPGPGLALPPILALATPEQAENLLTCFDAESPRWGAFAVTEPGVGSDATAIATTAKQTSNGYVLNGTKCFITNGARAEFAVVFASIDRSRARFGIRAFIVPRGHGGYRVDRCEKMIGLRCSQLASISMVECELPASALLGGHRKDRADTFSAAQKAWDFMRPILTALMIGACQRVRDELVSLANRFPLRATPSLPAAVEEMDRRIHVCQMFAAKAAWKYDQGMPMSRDASIAKYYAASTSSYIADSLAQTCRPEWFVETPFLDKFYRDSKAFDVMEGTGDMQALMIGTFQKGASLDFLDQINI